LWSIVNTSSSSPFLILFAGIVIVGVNSKSQGKADGDFDDNELESPASDNDDGIIEATKAQYELLYAQAFLTCCSTQSSKGNHKQQHEEPMVSQYTLRNGHSFLFRATSALCEKVRSEEKQLYSQVKQTRFTSCTFPQPE
jgi:hypothetical protein